MRKFHISDVLSVTTGRLVSTRHMDGIYDILNFLTGDNLFTHQLPRAMDECRPWLRTQFPGIMEDSPTMVVDLARLDAALNSIRGDKWKTDKAIAKWLEEVRVAYGLPKQIPVYELGADMHAHIDPIEEAEAMVGKGRVIVVEDKEEIG